MGEVARAEGADVAHVVAQQRQHRRLGIPAVADASGDRQRATGTPGRFDREVRGLLGNDAAEPDQTLAARTHRPRSRIDAVVQHRRGHAGARPFPPRVVAHREERAARAARGGLRGDEARIHGRVQRRHHGDAEARRRPQRQRMQGVVGHDIEQLRSCRDPFERARQRRDGDLLVRIGIGRVRGDGRIPPLQRGQLEHRAGRGEVGPADADEGDLVAALGEGARFGPHGRLQAAGVGRADGEPHRSDHEDAQAGGRHHAARSARRRR